MRDSHLFASMLKKIEDVFATYLGGSYPPQGNVPAEERLRIGTTSHFPLELEDQDIHELECFLGLLYPLVLRH